MGRARLQLGPVPRSKKLLQLTLLSHGKSHHAGPPLLSIRPCVVLNPGSRAGNAETADATKLSARWGPERLSLLT